MMSRFQALVAAAVVLGAPLSASAQLQFLGPVDQNGTGFGHVNTVLTLQSPANTSTEAGCIGPTGVVTCLAGDLVPGNSHSNLFTVGTFPGLSGSNLRLFLNFAEPGNALDGTLNNATLTLYNGTTPLFTSSTGTVNFPTTFPGIGNSGFAFGLSASDATLFDSFLAKAGSSAYTLGLSASLSNVTGGPETFYLGMSTTPSIIPEPSSLALFGTGLVGLMPIVRRKRRG